MVRNKRFYRYGVLAMFILFACSKQTPDGILTKDKLRDVLIQLHLAEGKAMSLNLPADTAYRYYRNFENETFEKMGITRAVFDSSFRYYFNDVKEMDGIYAQVVDSLSLREGLRPK